MAYDPALWPWDPDAWDEDAWDPDSWGFPVAPPPTLFTETIERTATLTRTIERTTSIATTIPLLSRIRHGTD